jgi:surface polysaccharide O-acyltransferase-like enzyme
MFKKNVHNFRGISIVFIVFSHCYFFSICNFGNNENFFAKMFKNMISGGSAFFVFISGFLFLSIYKSNERYFDFLLKKIRFVYLPFLFFILFDLFYIILMNVLNFISPSDRYHFYREALFNFDFLSVYFVGKSFVTSGILWYVPFIMFIYLLSPIFLSYSKLN